MPSAFSTGLSGLRSHSQAVEVVANNLANLNTFAFKRSRAEFRDLFYEQVGFSRSGVASQIGLGVAPITVSQRFEQGTVQNTGGLLDAAIQGDGFFIVRDNELTQFTRAGNFQLNAAQELVTINGENVQGWVRNPVTGEINTGLPMTNITLSGVQTLPPSPTTELRLTANLSATAEVGDVFSVPVEVFDSIGDSHVLNVQFERVATNAGAASSWEVQVLLPAGDAAGAPMEDPNILDGGNPVTLDFDSQGSLINPNMGTPPPPFDLLIDMSTAGVDFANGAAPLVADWPLTPGGQPSLTNFASDSAAFDIFQNGAPPAELTSISIADGGQVNGLFSDGRTLTLAVLGLAAFDNPQTLLAQGNNNFVPTSASGQPVTGPANTAGLGSILGLSLEFSNVDIAEEFTNLLSFQRGFQANSRVITTADELNQEALSLKR